MQVSWNEVPAYSNTQIERREIIFIRHHIFFRKSRFIKDLDTCKRYMGTHMWFLEEIYTETSSDLIAIKTRLLDFSPKNL